MGMTLEKKMLPVVITNPEMISDSMDLRGKSYVAKLRVWNDEESMWKVNYYQRAFKTASERKHPLTLVKSYFGSSKGKNKANPDILKDMQKSSKNPEIEILHFCDTPFAAYIEQENITLHNWPLGGGHKDSIDCYNKNNGVGRYTVPHKTMLSRIQKKRLSKKLILHKLWVQSNGVEGEQVFRHGFRSDEQIRKIVAEKRFVQCRITEEGNEEYISYYTTKQSGLASWKGWNGRMTMFMPEDDSEDNDEMLDGNESARASMRVPNMDGLGTIEIPYEDHCFLLLEEKRSLGNVMNAPKEDRQDHTASEDVVRNCKNLIIRDKLYTRGGNPNFEHPTIKETLSELNFSEVEIKFAIREAAKYFKEVKLANRKEQEAYYDYTPEALIQRFDEEGNPIPNNNLEQWNKSVDKIHKTINRKRIKNGDNPIIFTEENTIKISFGMYGYDKIALHILNCFRTNKKVPQDLLVLVFFNFESEQKLFCRTKQKKKDKEFFETRLFASECKNIMIRPVPMTKN